MLLGTYVTVSLSEKNKHQLYLPLYCAHRFLVLSDVAEVIKVDNVYALDYDCGLRWNDSNVNIPWPTKAPILSSHRRTSSCNPCVSWSRGASCGSTKTLN